MGNLDILGRSSQTTHIWVKQAAEELNWKDERRVFLALRAVLHALRDRLTNDEAVQLAAQLPTFVRGCYYEGWRPKKRPVRDVSRYGFLAEVQKAFSKTHDPDVDSLGITRAIFRLLDKKVSEGEIQDIRSSLPAQLRELWPETKRVPKPIRVRARVPKSKAAIDTGDELVKAALENGRATVGLARTLRVLNYGRAWEILYVSGVRFRGFECPQCAGLFPAGFETCSFCNSPLVFVPDMTKRLVGRATERGIKVRGITGAAAASLSKAGGIGAFLKTTRRIEEGT